MVIGLVEAFLAGKVTDHCCRSFATAVFVASSKVTVTFTPWLACPHTCIG